MKVLAAPTGPMRRRTISGRRGAALHDAACSHGRRHQRDLPGARPDPRPDGGAEPVPGQSPHERPGWSPFRTQPRRRGHRPRRRPLHPRLPSSATSASAASNWLRSPRPWSPTPVSSSWTSPRRRSPSTTFRGVFDLIRRLAAEGRSVIYISHRLDEVLEIGDRATVLRDGRTVAHSTLPRPGRRLGHGDDRAPARPPRSGRRGQLRSPAPRLAIERVVLRVVSTSATSSCDRARWSASPDSAAPAAPSLLKALFGSQRGAHVAASIDGRRLSPPSPGQAVRAGIGLVPEDRKGEGLLRELSVVRNAGLAA